MDVKGRSVVRSARGVLAGMCMLVLAGAPEVGARPVSDTPVPAAALATAEQQTALDRMNTYRQLAGVAPVHGNTALNRAAVNHAIYYVLNADDPALSGLGLHEEQAGKPGFTGVTMADRIAGQGYKGSWNESIALLGDPAAAVDAFMTLVNHRLPILDPAYTDMGYGGTPRPGARIDVFTFGGQPPRPSAPEFIAYPANDMTGISPIYTGQEISPAFPDAQYPVGTAITFKYTGAGALAVISATLTDPTGTVVPVLSRLSYNFTTRNTLVLAATQPLARGTRYRVRIDGTRAGAPFTRAWAFTTALGDQQPLPAPAMVATDRFTQVWAGPDWPLAAGYLNRSWVWGPSPLATLQEAYQQGTNGHRAVQYWDKARMEINKADADPTAPWYVTNGLLVAEMVGGYIQTGDTQTEPRPPAEAPIVGDPRTANADAPSYAAMRGVTSLAGDHPATDRSSSPILEYMDRWGVVNTNERLIGYGVRAGHYVAETKHNIADKFWTYFGQQGLVYEQGILVAPRPLITWEYVAGYPISEPYWVTAEVGGQPYAVLVQLFQRRVLTYIPKFAPEWQVQMGNVGQHYYAWRYNK